MKEERLALPELTFDGIFTVIFRRPIEFEKRLKR
jgi:hypothetical protein